MLLYAMMNKFYPKLLQGCPYIGTWIFKDIDCNATITPFMPPIIPRVNIYYFIYIKIVPLKKYKAKFFKNIILIIRFCFHQFLEKSFSVSPNFQGTYKAFGRAFFNDNETIGWLEFIAEVLPNFNSRAVDFSMLGMG